MHCASASSNAPSSSAFRICSSVSSMEPSGVRPDRSFSAASVSSGAASGSCAASSGVSCCRITGLFSCAVSAVSVLSVVSGSASSARPGTSGSGSSAVFCAGSAGFSAAAGSSPCSAVVSDSAVCSAGCSAASGCACAVGPSAVRGLFRAVRSAFFRRSRRPGLFLPEELCFPAPVPSRSAAGRWAAPSQPPCRSARFMAAPKTADGQHHGHSKNSRSLAPAACRRSVVPNSFHAVLLRLRIPVLVIVCRRKSGRPFMHFHTGSVYTRCRPAVNRLDFAAVAAAHGQACVRTPEKYSKGIRFAGQTLHKAEISCFCRRKSRFFLLS